MFRNLVGQVCILGCQKDFGTGHRIVFGRKKAFLGTKRASDGQIMLPEAEQILNEIAV